jgi:hypothetical protein
MTLNLQSDQKIQFKMKDLRMNLKDVQALMKSEGQNNVALSNVIDGLLAGASPSADHLKAHGDVTWSKGSSMEEPTS